MKVCGYIFMFSHHFSDVELFYFLDAVPDDETLPKTESSLKGKTLLLKKHILS